MGDVMFLDTGDKVIADGIAIDSQGLVLDEASLTGACVHRFNACC